MEEEEQAVESEDAPTPSDSMTPKQERGRLRRAAIIRATAAIITSEGVSSVSHRKIAAKAKVPLASTTYYFSDLEELLEAAGHLQTTEWIEHANTVADVAEHAAPQADLHGKARVIVEAMIPPGGDRAICGHYERLVDAARNPALSRAFADARPALDASLVRVLNALGYPAEQKPLRVHQGCRVDPELVLALIDGAAVSALSEGHDVRESAQRVVAEYLRLVGGSPGVCVVSQK